MSILTHIEKPKKGLDRSVTGRAKGTVNKSTAILKEAILKAAESVGSDGNGADGLTGYCQLLAKTEPKAFSTLLGKVLPLQIATDPGSPVRLEVTWVK